MEPVSTARYRICVLLRPSYMTGFHSLRFSFCFRSSFSRLVHAVGGTACQHDKLDFCSPTRQQSTKDWLTLGSASPFRARSNKRLCSHSNGSSTHSSSIPQVNPKVQKSEVRGLRGRAEDTIAGLHVALAQAVEKAGMLETRRSSVPGGFVPRLYILNGHNCNTGNDNRYRYLFNSNSRLVCRKNCLTSPLHVRSAVAFINMTCTLQQRGRR